MENFAILHKLKTTQFLVDSNYDHDEDEYHITVKFWSDEINGYFTATMSWKSQFEDGFNQMFDKFKSKKYCVIFMKGAEAKLLTSDLETKIDGKGNVVQASFTEQL